MFFKRLTVLFYVTIIMFVGAFFLLFAMQVIDLNNILTYTRTFYYDSDLRMIVGIVAVIILLCNFLFYRYFSVNVHRDKVIAFDNPSGRVSVSLMAMEDLIKKTVLTAPEIKDSRIKITAHKKGLNVKVRLKMKSGSHIPDLTSKVQEKVKRKIQDTIGLEEAIDVAIYVGKIIPEKVKGKAIKEEFEEPKKEEGPTVPFTGYRA